MSEVKRKLAAIMFTDIVGYTALMGSDEDRAFEVLRKNREIHTSLTKKYGGTLIKEMGDGMLISFDVASDAVKCATDIQKECKDHKIPLKIGIHEGEMVFEGSDVLGDGVNIASRIQDGTEEGCIMISDSVYKDVKNKPGIHTEFVEKRRYKNVDDPIRIYRILCGKDSLDGTEKQAYFYSIIRKIVRKGKRRSIVKTIAVSMVILLLLILSSWWVVNTFYNGKTRIQTLAVLPFKNYIGIDGWDFYVDGMHASLITDISKIGSIMVISETSSRKYKNKEMSIPEIAKDLKADVIIEGSVLCIGDSICSQVRLYEAGKSEYQIWSQEYTEHRSQILNWNSKVTKKITEKIDITLSPSEEEFLATSRIVNPNAHEACLKGRSYYELGTKSDLDSAMYYYQLAKEIDPNYALAYLGIWAVWRSYSAHGFMPGSVTEAKGSEAMKKAMLLDSSLVEIRTSMAGYYGWRKWDWGKAGTEFRKAIESNPNYGDARAYYSHYLAITGNPEKGLPHGELAIKLDPFNTLYQSLHGQALKNARKYEEALELLEDMYEKEPDQGIGLPALLAVYHELGKYEEALAIAKRIYDLKGIEVAIQSLEAGNREGGYHMGWRRTAEMMINYIDTTYFPPWQIFTIYCRAGMKEEAMFWLEKAFQAHDYNLPFISVDPLMDFLRDEPCFQAILKEMNLSV